MKLSQSTRNEIRNIYNLLDAWTYESGSGMCLLLFGKKQLHPSYVLKALVLEVFPHYRKYNSHKSEEHKKPSNQCVVLDRQQNVYHTLIKFKILIIRPF